MGVNLTEEYLVFLDCFVETFISSIHLKKHVFEVEVHEDFSGKRNFGDGRKRLLKIENCYLETGEVMLLELLPLTEFKENGKPNPIAVFYFLNFWGFHSNVEHL